MKSLITHRLFCFLLLQVTGQIISTDSVTVLSSDVIGQHHTKAPDSENLIHDLEHMKKQGIIAVPEHGGSHDHCEQEDSTIPQRPSPVSYNNCVCKSDSQIKAVTLSDTQEMQSSSRTCDFIETTLLRSVVCMTSIKISMMFYGGNGINRYSMGSILAGSWAIQQVAGFSTPMCQKIIDKVHGN